MKTPILIVALLALTSMPGLAAPRVPLAPGSEPNMIRALAPYPGLGASFAHLIDATNTDGRLPGALKQAMGLKIATLNGSPYVTAYLKGLGAAPVTTPQDALAVRYAQQLTLNVHGVSDSDFHTLRQFYTDPQIVEMTLTVCVFNYWTRLANALAVPSDTNLARLTPTKSESALTARVGLLIDDEIKAIGLAAAPRPATAGGNGLGLALVNSQRAMLQAPAMAGAWGEYWSAVRKSATLPRELLLQVSFAVSMANGCRYCTLHQILGLHRLGVDPAKLLAMKKDDSALTPRERTAVVFARRLTKTPAGVTDADYTALQSEFGAAGAAEVVFQTCAFNFMNRFTDGLRLPSEDEAVHTYQEVYGPQTYHTDWPQL